MFGSGVDEALAAAEAALDGLQAIDPMDLDASSLPRWVVAVHGLQKRMDAVATTATGAFDRVGDPEGALGAAPWVAWKCGVRREAAGAEVARARALRHMPETAAAFAAGRISTDHVRLLAAAWRAAPEAFEAKEHQLVGDAIDLGYDAFRRSMQYFRLEHDRDGEDRRSAEAFDRRELFASQSFEDTVEIKGTLDPVGGAVYLDELRMIEQAMFEEDWAEARARLGDDARAQDLRRTPAQRRADAQVEMAVRSRTLRSLEGAGERPRTPVPLISVLMGYETFHGMLSQLADGTVVPPSTLVPFFGAGIDVERIVFDGPSRVVDVGARQRLFRGATRRAVELRDQVCWHPSCDVPFTRCDVDHIQPYAHDGPTVQSNGRVACPGHNPGRRRPYQPPPDDDD